MADAVLNQTLYQGVKKLITHYQNVSDNSGGTTTVVDVSGLDTDTLGNACATVTLNKVWYSVSMTAKVDAVKLTWDADTDATFLTLEQSGFLDYSSIGGIKNNKATNYTGDVKFVMPACKLMIVLQLRANGLRITRR